MENINNAELTAKALEAKELERLQADVRTYEAQRKQIKKKHRWILLGILAVFLPIYLYLRLFNTHFVSYENSPEEIYIKYSTAWYIKVPAEYNGYEIKSLPGMNLNKRAPYARYINLENGITYIDGLASDTLLGIRIPETIEDIGYCAFSGIESLRWVSFPEKVSDLAIHDQAFMYTSIHEAILPEGTTYVGDFAFGRCDSLKKASLPDTVSYEGYGVFSGCDKLESVKLSEQCTVIPAYFFSNCDALEEISWPSNLRSISPEALEGSGFKNKAIADLNLPDSVYFATTSNSVHHKDILYDKDKENRYISEATGIPLEVFEKSMNTNDIWIEGNWYRLSMYLNTFLEKDDWTVLEEDSDYAVVQHAKTGTTLRLYLREKCVYGCSTSSSRCVFPGGLICQKSKCYRGCINADDNYDFTSSFSYSFGANEQYHISGGYDLGSDEILRDIKFIVAY